MKKFKYTLRDKNSQILLQEIIEFGDKNKPFPKNWQKNKHALKMLNDYKMEFFNNHFDISFEESDKFDI